MRCDNELQDINKKVRKNESATAQFEISQNRNFQKKTKPLEPQNPKEKKPMLVIWDAEELRTGYVASYC